MTGAFGLFWAILWWPICSPEKHPWLSKEELSHIREGEQELATVKAPKGVFGKIVLPQRNFWALGIARFFSEPAWQFFSYWIPLYLATERNMNLKQIGYFAWLPFLAADLGSMFGGVLSPFFINKMHMSVLTARKCAATVSAFLMVFAVFCEGAFARMGHILFLHRTFAHQSMSATLMTLAGGPLPENNGRHSERPVRPRRCRGMIFTAIVGNVAQTIGYGPLFTTIAFLDIIGVAFRGRCCASPNTSLR